jgi:hypothetical protein
MVGVVVKVWRGGVIRWWHGTETREAAVILILTDSYPGYWGAGETEEVALANLKAAGGRPSKTGTIRFVLSDSYDDPRVDGMGGVTARYKGDPEDTNRPPIVDEAWRVGPRGKRTLIHL